MKEIKKVKKIIIHHSGSPRDKTTVDDIMRWHVFDNEWSDIGYHWMIDGKGAVHMGRSERLRGAHCKGHNKDSLGICVFGNFDKEALTEKQKESLQILVTEILDEHDLEWQNVYPHGELAKNPTACPGHDLSHFLYFL